MSALWDFITALPALFKLVMTLRKRIEQAELDRKVSEDVAKIHGAFNAKDPSILNDLFNS